MFPFNSSVTRRLASLHRIARGSLLRLPQYYQGAPTSHRPFRLALFRSPGGTTDCRSSSGSGELLLTGSSSELHAGASILCLDSHSWRRRDLPGSSATPLANMLCSPTPADRMHQASCDARDILPSVRLTTSAPHSVTFRGSITQPVRSLSTLRGSDCSDRTPRKTRFPLAANLGGSGLSPAGLLQEVSTLCFNSHRFLLLVAFPAAPADVPRACSSEPPEAAPAAGPADRRLLSACEGS